MPDTWTQVQVYEEAVPEYRSGTCCIFKASEVSREFWSSSEKFLVRNGCKIQMTSSRWSTALRILCNAISKNDRRSFQSNAAFPSFSFVSFLFLSRITRRGGKRNACEVSFTTVTRLEFFVALRTRKRTGLAFEMIFYGLNFLSIYESLVRR